MDTEQIPVTLTAAQMDGIDAANLAIFTLSNDARQVRVPIGLTVYLPAGDAYTVGAGSRFQVIDEDGDLLFDMPCEGFFDQTTEQAVFLRPSAGKYRAGNYILSVKCNGSIAKGTASSSVRLRLFFERFPLY